MYKWHQSNNLVFVSFNIATHITKSDIQADITSTTIALGVKGYGLNCEGTLFSSIKGSKWAIKDGIVQVQMDKQQAGTKWTQLLSEVTESNPKGIVLFEYEATADEELSLSQHEVINIISKDDSGWWEGSKQSSSAVFPSNFLQEFPSDYQATEDIEATNEATKSEEAPINQVSRVGINMMGNMDELRNKLANRKTATYTPNDIEESIANNKEETQELNNSGNGINNSGGGNGGFVAVQPTGGVRGGLQRTQGKMLLNNRASQQVAPTPTTTPAITPIQPMVQLKSTPTKDNSSSLNSSNNTVPTVATTSKESSQSTSKESTPTKDDGSTSSSSSSHKSSITSMFKKPLKKIQSITALTGGSHSHDGEKPSKDNSGSKTKAKVVYDFETKEPNELALKKGDIIVVLSKDSTPGWWQGINQSTQATGWFSSTFVEEIKEVAPPTPTPTPSSDKSTPTKQVKSPPPKLSSSTNQTVESKLQSLSETPKLETVRKAGVAKGRKPPTRIRASYLLSDEEREEREKLKQSFYSHVVSSSQREIEMEEEEERQEQQDRQQLTRSNPSIPPSEKPSKPPPPKRTPAMNTSLNSPPLSTNADGPSPPLKAAPPPPPKSNKPTLSSSDGYEPSTPSPPSSTNSSSEDTFQKSPVLSKKTPLPPSSENNGDTPPPISKPPLKPTPKPRANMPLPTQDNNNTTPAPPSSTPSHEVNFKANLKPPKSTSPPINTSQELVQPPQTTESTSATTTPQPTPPQLKKVVKPPVQPPTNAQSNELTEKLNKFSDLAENSVDSIGTTPTTTAPVKQPKQQQQSPTSPTIDSTNTTSTKPAVRPPLKKVPASVAPTSTEETITVTQPPASTSPPVLSSGKPKLTPRSNPTSPTITPANNNVPTQPTAPTTHKRNLSNPNSAPPTTKKPITTTTTTQLPSFNDIILEISNICNEISESSNNSQEQSTTFKHIYPSLIESFFSVAVCSNDGQFWGNDDALNDHQVPMFQAIYPFLYAILCDEIGVDEVSKYISDQSIADGNNNNNKPINDQKKAFNPFTLAGQLVSSHLFTLKYPSAVTRIFQFLNIIQQLVNSSTVSCDMVSYLSQKSDTSDEILVGHLLKSSGLIKTPDEALEFFYQLNSIQLNSKQISVLAATLASDGVCPFSPSLQLAPKPIISKTNEILKQCNSSSITSNTNKSFISKFIPFLSDSGVLLIIVPGLMGISIVSPCNNNNTNDNSLLPNENHIEFCKKLYSILDK